MSAYSTVQPGLVLDFGSPIFSHLGQQAAYTFDAGPNAVIYALEKDIPQIIALAAKYFPSDDPSEQYDKFVINRTS